MNVENKKKLVDAFVKKDTTELRRMVEILGGTKPVLDLFKNLMVDNLRSNPHNTEMSTVFLVAIEGSLKRIERQIEGEQILKQSTL